MRDISLPPELSVKTYNFVTGNAEYYNKVKQNFLFGESKYVHQKHFAQELEKLLPRDRNIALVGHDMREDLFILELLGIDLKTLIVARFDTKELAKQVQEKKMLGKEENRQNCGGAGATSSGAESEDLQQHRWRR
jgi:hypothetical protein